MPPRYWLTTARPRTAWRIAASCGAEKWPCTTQDGSIEVCPNTMESARTGIRAELNYTIARRVIELSPSRYRAKVAAP
jgi:hypothetical protein